MEEFLYSLPLLIFREPSSESKNPIEWFEKTPTWQTLRSKYQNIRLKYLYKGIEQQISDDLSYLSGLKTTNGQAHYLYSDYNFNLSSRSPSPHYLYCKVCEYRNNIIRKICVNCQNEDNDQLVYKKGSFKEPLNLG